jgi:hypothetical protein
VIVWIQALNFSILIAATLIVESMSREERKSDNCEWERERGWGPQPLLVYFSTFGGTNVLMGVKL